MCEHMCVSINTFMFFTSLMLVSLCMFPCVNRNIVGSVHLVYPLLLMLKLFFESGRFSLTSSLPSSLSSPSSFIIDLLSLIPYHLFFSVVIFSFFQVCDTDVKPVFWKSVVSIEIRTNVEQRIQAKCRLRSAARHQFARSGEISGALQAV